MVRPSGRAQTRYSSSTLKKKLSAVAPFAESGSGTGARCGRVVPDHRGHAASKFDPEGTPSQVLFGSLFFCDNLLPYVGASDCRGGSRPSRSR